MAPEKFCFNETRSVPVDLFLFNMGEGEYGDEQVESFMRRFGAVHSDLVQLLEMLKAFPAIVDEIGEIEVYGVRVPYTSKRGHRSECWLSASTSHLDVGFHTAAEPWLWYQRMWFLGVQSVIDFYPR